MIERAEIPPVKKMGEGGYLHGTKPLRPGSNAYCAQAG